METYSFHRGSTPLLISIPHAGTEVPVSIAQRFTAHGRDLTDTDWHVEKLYAFARELGASIICANYSRYVVDLNRAPDNAALYAAHPASAVCPLDTFTDEPLYVSGQNPDVEEVRERIETWWRPYHDRLETELQALRTQHGIALLWDAHSIASEVPGLFEGVVPEFSFGTRDHAACPADIANALLDVVTRDGGYGAVLNGRFRGGYITQHYGRPGERMFAVQLELAQRAYMDEARRSVWDAPRAERTRVLIEKMLRCFLRSSAS